MNNSFLNETFLSLTQGERVNISDLLNYVAFKDKNFILKHNIDAIASLVKFLNSSGNIFILNGFMGSGKTYVADCITDFISDEVLLFRNSYQEAINLDDVLLSMFKDFTLYHNEKKITLPKVDTNIFSEKINAYIKACDKPLLFVFDSFEINMRSKATQKDILDFINFLSHFAKIKVIICSRTFRIDDLISQDSAQVCALKSLSSDEMFEYLEQNDIKGSRYEAEELYKVTRGHYLLLELSVFIMQLLGLSLTAFSSEYKKSTKNFLEFLIGKILSVSSERFLKVMIFMTLVRHGVSLDFIENQKISQEDDIEFLRQKFVISEKFDRYYLKDYIKNEFVKAINTSTKLKMHKYIKEVYEAELPLKPYERQLFLSRLTMRQEIAYHDKKIKTLEEEMENSLTPWTKESQGMPYLSYVKTSGYNIIDEKKNRERHYIRKSNANKFIKTDMTKEDMLLYGASGKKDAITEHFEAISSVPEEKIKEEHKQDVFDLIPDCLEDYVKLAKDCEDIFNFSDAILYYRKALTYTKDAEFTAKEPLIYLKLASCYKKIQNLEQAVKIYEKAYLIYSKISFEQACNVLLKLADLYCEVYKFDKAKEIYQRILGSSQELSVQSAVRVYLNLANLEENNSDIEMAVKYIKKAIAVSEKSADTSLLAECYYHYAVLLEDTNNIEQALKAYLRCVQISGDIKINTHLADAYSNLADISFDKNNKNAAKMYLELAIDADKANDNFEGLYYSYSKLAEIYKDDKSEKILDYLTEALLCAKKVEDNSLVVMSYLHLGDYHYAKKDYAQTLKSYILAKTILPSEFSEDMELQINNRINKLKLTLGDNQYNNLLETIKKRR